MDFEIFNTPGLGDSSYLLRSADEGVLIDPQRDAWRFLAVADRMGVRIRAVLETHVHNDYVSGAHEVRAATGAEAKAAYDEAVKLLDRAGRKRLIHPSAAARQKSRLAKVVGKAKVKS